MARIDKTDEREWSVPAPEPVMVPDPVPTEPTEEPAEVPA